MSYFLRTSDGHVLLRSHLLASGQPAISTFSFLLLFFFHLRSVLLVRGAATAERQTSGPLPIIRNKKGMTRRASLHWEMTKYRHFMDAEAEAGRSRHKLACSCCWCCSPLFFWTPRIMAASPAGGETLDDCNCLPATSDMLWKQQQIF